MHKVQKPSENSQKAKQNQTPFPVLDDVAVQLFIDHAAAKLQSAPPVVKAELKNMVPSGPPLGEFQSSPSLRRPGKSHSAACDAFRPQLGTTGKP